MKNLFSKVLLSKNNQNRRWQDTRPSETAKAVAKLRYMAARFKNYNFEKLAFENQLVSPIFRGLCFLFLNQFRSFMEKLAPGLIGSLIARTYFIDDTIAKYIDKIDQIVILGAGFDGRAYGKLNSDPKITFPERFTIYELDLYLTLQHKKKLVVKIGKPKNLYFGEFDAEKDNIVRTLEHLGASLDAATLFIMEGFTYYINEESIHYLFKKISKLNAVVVFDYYVDDFINKKNDSYYGAKKYIHNIQPHLFEGQVTGLPDEISKFLEPLNFKNIVMLTPEQSESLYLNKMILRDLGFVRYASAETHHFAGRVGAIE